MVAQSIVCLGYSYPYIFSLERMKFVCMTVKCWFIYLNHYVQSDNPLSNSYILDEICLLNNLNYNF